MLTAAHLCGVDEIYRIGKAMVAAPAYGTEDIQPVDKIVGPGNAYVAAAKRRVFGQVGIDMIAGPSKTRQKLDSANDPAWIAADLLSQAEHDADAQSILITDSADFAKAVDAAVEAQLQTLPRAEIAGASWRNNGGIILVSDVDDCAALVDRLAPEHLEIATEDPKALLSQIRNAGSAFLGRYTPEPMGDYIAGPNHVLLDRPCCTPRVRPRCARFHEAHDLPRARRRLTGPAGRACAPSGRSRGPVRPRPRHSHTRQSLTMADKLTKVELAEAFNAHLSPKAQQEQQIAVFDLVEDNVFKPTGMVDKGPSGST